MRTLRICAQSRNLHLVVVIVGIASICAFFFSGHPIPIGRTTQQETIVIIDGEVLVVGTGLVLLAITQSRLHDYDLRRRRARLLSLGACAAALGGTEITAIAAYAGAFRHYSENSLEQPMFELILNNGLLITALSACAVVMFGIVPGIACGALAYVLFDIGLVQFWDLGWWFLGSFRGAGPWMDPINIALTSSVVLLALFLSWFYCGYFQRPR